MIWDWDDQQAMRRIFGQVWQSMKITPPWPRHITSRWTTSPRGRTLTLTLTLPLPRRWLGGSDPRPHHTHHTLTH